MRNRVSIYRWAAVPFLVAVLGACTDTPNDTGVAQDEAALAASLPPLADNCFLAIAACVGAGTTGRACWGELVACETPIGHGSVPGEVNPPIAVPPPTTPPDPGMGRSDEAPPAEQAGLPDEGRDEAHRPPPGTGDDMDDAGDDTAGDDMDDVDDTDEGGEGDEAASPPITPPAAALKACRTDFEACLTAGDGPDACITALRACVSAAAPPAR